MAYSKTSPSQITTFRLCQRRWHFGSIQRLPQPESPDAAEGTKLHREMEGYETEGIEPKHPSCRMATAFIPPPKTEGVVIETKTTDPTFYIGGVVVDGENVGGTAVNGRIDYLDERDPKHPRILDWKSKGSLKGALSKAKLSQELQLHIYGAWALAKYPEADVVTLAHGYIVRDPEKAGAKLVEVEMTRDEVTARVAALEPTVEAMKVAAELPADRIAELEGNEKACWAFGQRCPFYDPCPRKQVQSFSEVFGEVEDMGLIDKLRASPGAVSIPDPSEFVGVAAATPVPALAGTVSTEAPADGSGGALLRRLRGAR